MKRVIKIALIALGVLVVVVIGGVVYLSSSGLPEYEFRVVEVSIDKTPERIANGKRLSLMMCSHCHLDSRTQALTGKRMDDLPSDFGTVSSKNITQDPEFGIGNWTDGELYYFLRTGINPKRNGMYIPPWMPKYPHVADQDLYDIIAYLRSSEPEVQPARVANGEVDPSLLVLALARVAFKPMPYPDKPIARPDTTDLKAFGKYLANGMFGCFECHAEDFKTMNVLVPEQTPGFYGGGNQLIEMNGTPVYSRNLTPDKAHGIGAWSDDEVKIAIREGFRPDGSALHYPMLRGKFLTEQELNGIVAYLRSLPVLSTKNKPRPVYDLPATASQGEKLYYTYGCASCHGKSGNGYGDLTKANAKYPSEEGLLDVIRHPSNYWPNTLMPTWGERIPMTDIKLIAAHVRTLGK